MPTSVFDSQCVLIIRLICHDEIVYEEMILKSHLHFPSLTLFKGAT